MAAPQAGRVQGQAAFVLHTLPYKETSLIVDVLTRDYGRLSLVARGARRPRAAIRGMMVPFAPLALSWFGKNELKTLADADWVGGVPQLSGVDLLAGFYLNELLLKLTGREDPHPDLFADYSETITHLAFSGRSLAVLLRRFELRLLQHLGYAPRLACDTEGNALQSELRYVYLRGQGPVRQTHAAGETGCDVSGATLLALQGGESEYSVSVQREARLLLSQLLSDCLSGAPLATRELLHALPGLSVRC